MEVYLIMEGMFCVRDIQFCMDIYKQKTKRNTKTIQLINWYCMPECNLKPRSILTLLYI